MTTMCPMPAAVVPPPAKARVEHEHAPAVARQRARARRTDDAGADDDRVGADGRHARHASHSPMPSRNGIGGIEAQRRVAGDERGAANVRNQLAVVACRRASR